MGTRQESVARGLLIPDPRTGLEGLAVNDGSALGSDYAQTGPRPGTSTTTDPKSRVVAVVTGALSAAIQIDCEQAGDPGVDASAARFSWRLSGEGATEERGHNAPQCSTYFSPVALGVAGLLANVAFDVVVDPISQRLAVGYTDTEGGNSRFATVRSVGLDAFTIAKATLQAPSADACLAVLPSGRVLAYASEGMTYSDEVWGSELLPVWATYRDQCLSDITGLAASTRARMYAFPDGSVLLIIELAFGSVRQFASRNLGAYFRPVGAAFVLNAAGVASKVSIVGMPDGSAVVGHKTTGGAGKVRRLGSAFDPLEEAAEIDVGVASANYQICADPRGVIFAVHGDASAIGCAVSFDGGLTWEAHLYGPFESPSNGYGIGDFVVAAARGSLWLIHAGVGTAPASEQLGCLRLGGWSNDERTFSAAGIGLAESLDGRQTGWYQAAGTVVPAYTWIPWDVPSAFASAFTAGGAVAGVIADGWMKIATVAQDGHYSIVPPLGVLGTLYASTSATGAGGAIGTSDHGIGLRLANAGGTLSYGFTVHILATASEVRFRVIDLKGGATLFELAAASNFVPPAAAAADPFLEFMIRIEAGEKLWFKYRRSDRVKWTIALSGATMTTSAANPTGLIRFGAVATGTTLQTWRGFYWRDGSTGQSGAVYQDLNRSGQALSGNAYPLALAGVVDVDEAHVAIRGGPAIRDETHTIPVIHDFPIDAAMWDSGPSRAVRWRSTDDTTTQTIAWAFTNPTRIGDSFLLAFMALDVNFPEAYLETYAAGVWTRRATLNLEEGFEDLIYERDGDVFIPGTLAANVFEGDRFLNRAELGGGYVRWGTAATGAGVGSIVRQAAGGWVDNGINTVLPVIRTDGAIAGTAAISNGALSPVDGLSLQAPSGLVVAYLTKAQASNVEAVRIVIPGGAGLTAEGYLRAGMLMVGTVSVFGQQPSRGYSVETRPNAIREQSRGGTIRKHSQGKPTTSHSLAWPDGVKLHGMRGGTDVDYLGPPGKPAAVADSDVWGQLWGIMDETSSGEIPVVYIAALPADDVTLTDRTLFGFGSLDGSVRFDHVLGKEGASEFGRVAGVKISGSE